MSYCISDKDKDKGRKLGDPTGEHGERESDKEARTINLVSILNDTILNYRIPLFVAMLAPKVIPTSEVVYVP